MPVDPLRDRPAHSEVHLLWRGPRRLTVSAVVPDGLVQAWMDGDPLDAARPLWGWEERRDLGLLTTPIGPLVAKRMEARGLRALRTRLGGGRARHAFRVGRAMAARDIATPEPLAWLREDRRGRSSVLITRLAPGKSPWAYLRGERAPTEPGAGGTSFRRALLDALATTLGSMHAQGFRHRDLKILNLRIETCATGVRAWLLDLDAARPCARPACGALVVRDLGRLAASFLSSEAREAGIGERDWSEFIGLYLQRCGAPADGAKLLEETLQWARAKCARNERLGRPLA